MVEAEEEYVSQLEVLVTCFLRPLRMAASSKKPPCTHEDISSIFLNSETVLFLHQIFFKGLTTRMENWPTLILSKWILYFIKHNNYARHNLYYNYFMLKKTKMYCNLFCLENTLWNSINIQWIIYTDLSIIELYKSLEKLKKKKK